MRISKRIPVILSALLLLLGCLPMRVTAAGPIDKSQDVSLTISYQDENVPLSGVEFNIFLAATVKETGELEIAENFNVDIRGENDSAWRELASTLEGYVLRDGIASAAGGVTNEAGLLTLPDAQGELEQGLYLVLGERHTQDDVVYECEPFMIMLPAANAENGEWIYDVTVSPKNESQELPKEETISRKVLKVWKDEGYEKERPQEITIQLLQDGRVADTVKLNAANNWRYTWDDLSAESDWTVVEQESADLSDYTVSVTKEGITFVVTNTYDVPEEPEEPTKPEEPKKPEEPTKPEEPPVPTLPQTGQLWWPVSILTTVGLLLIVIGLLQRRGKHER